MTVETALYISQLNENSPLGPDDAGQGDDHLRLLKSTAKNTFPTGSRAFWLGSRAEESSTVANFTDQDYDVKVVPPDWDNGKTIGIYASKANQFVRLPLATSAREGFNVTVWKAEASPFRVFIIPTSPDAFPDSRPFITLYGYEDSCQFVVAAGRWWPVKPIRDGWDSEVINEAAIQLDWTQHKQVLFFSQSANVWMPHSNTVPSNYEVILHRSGGGYIDVHTNAPDVFSYNITDFRLQGIIGNEYVHVKLIGGAWRWMNRRISSFDVTPPNTDFRTVAHFMGTVPLRLGYQFVAQNGNHAYFPGAVITATPSNCSMWADSSTIVFAAQGQLLIPDPGNLPTLINAIAPDFSLRLWAEM